MNSRHLTRFARTGYELLIAGASSLKSPFLLVVRLLLGLADVCLRQAHLSDVPAMVERFQEWGVPFPEFNVYVSGLVPSRCAARSPPNEADRAEAN